MSVNSIEVKSKIKDYIAIFEKDDGFLNRLYSLNNAVFVIDKNVWELYKDNSLKVLEHADKIILAIDEDRKNLDTVQELYDQIISYSPKKNLNIISIGGGILQDLTGFLASTLYRGVNWIFIPTTLLAQVDSCIGAKTSLNYKNFKNLIGTFYPPSEIYIYPEFSKTLTKNDYYSGMGEIAKLHLMGGERDTENFINSLKKLLEKENQTLLDIIQRSLLIKKSYIEEDEFDTGKRNMLNYGHCFGHAIETSTNFAVPHGQAVTLGMLIANIYSLNKGFLSSDKEKFIREKVLIPSIREEFFKFDLDVNSIIESMKHDKKNTGDGLALVMIGDNHNMIKITNMTEEEALEVLKTFKEIRANDDKSI